MKTVFLRTLQPYRTWPIINYLCFLPTGVFICGSFNYLWWKWVFKAIYCQQAIRKQTCPWCCRLCCIVWGNAWIIVNQIIKWMRKFFPLSKKLKLKVKYSSINITVNCWLQNCKGHPRTVFCKISVWRSKNCLEFSIAYQAEKGLKFLVDHFIQVQISKLI